MYFNQKTKKLHVPACGYYYISSHIYFQSDSSVSSSDSKYVRHQLDIKRNCGYNDDFLRLRSYSSLAATPTNLGRTTTYIGDVVKMCRGGSISVIIPDQYNPCCPYGRSQTTYLSAFMIADTTCEASRVLDHPPTDDDYASLWVFKEYHHSKLHFFPFPLCNTSMSFFNVVCIIMWWLTWLYRSSYYYLCIMTFSVSTRHTRLVSDRSRAAWVGGVDDDHFQLLSFPYSGRKKVI